MNINLIRPMPGRIIVKKLPDEVKTHGGVILTAQIVGKDPQITVEVIAVGSQASEDMGKKITVNIGDKCIMLGRSIYDTIYDDDNEYYIISEADILAVID